MTLKAHPNPASNDAFDTPTAAEAAFYRAFASTNIDRMAMVWADGIRVLCIHPGGDLLRGKTAVVRSWIELFSNADPPTIEYRLVGNFEAGNLAVHMVEELIRPKGSRSETSNRVMATNVFVREGNGWKMAEHHASLPIVAARKQAPEPSRLH
jgi:predicted SnoaL-like aldol condensation-catalyzing enzyme